MHKWSLALGAVFTATELAWMGTTDFWVSYAAAVSTSWCPLLCSDGGDECVICVSRAGDLKSLVSTEHGWHLLLCMGTVAGTEASAYNFLAGHHIGVQPCEHLYGPAAPEGHCLELNDTPFRVSYLLHCHPSLSLVGEKSKGTISDGLSPAHWSAGSFLPWELKGGWFLSKAREICFLVVFQYVITPCIKF